MKKFSRKHKGLSRNQDVSEDAIPEFLPRLVQPAAPAPTAAADGLSLHSARAVPSGDAILQRLAQGPCTLDELIGHFSLRRLSEQSALEKRLLELAGAHKIAMDLRGRMVLPAASAPTVDIEAPAPSPRSKPARKAAPDAKPAPAPKPAAAAPTPAPRAAPSRTEPREAPKPAAVGMEVSGKVSAHRDGFGFLLPETQIGGDVFLPMPEMRGLMSGDRILARITSVDAQGRIAGSFVKVLTPAPRKVVGRLAQEDGRWVVIPDNQKAQPFTLQVPKHELAQAKLGQVVEAEMVGSPTARGGPMGKVTTVLGEHLAPGLEIEIALRRHDLPNVWSEAVLAQSRAWGDKVRDADIAGREDLRALPLVTIDGADARDFDDAVYASAVRGGGWRLVVAIADVSHYVPAGSALDQEAALRGTSVYFPRRVIPMLPESLSNGLCSLNPQVDRLCFVCDMRIDRDGELGKAKFYPAVMRSHARLIYEDVALALDGSQTLGVPPELMGQLQTLRMCFEALFAARQRRGAIDFESSEVKFDFTDDGKIARIKPVQRNVAHRMIEECMIAANVQAAQMVAERETPAPHRVHERPDATRVQTLRDFLAGRAMTLEGGEQPEAKHFAAVAEGARGRPDTALIHSMILRSQSQARYAPDALGHFGLALAHYAHFTSPIRRYPDLLLHRAIRHVLARKKPATFVHTEEDIARYCDSSSAAERRADDASRDVSSWLKCEFMRHRLGETYDGVVTSVTSFGLFVELQGLYIDGLVHISALGQDFYKYDARAQKLVASRTGHSYAVGQPLRVQVARVSLEERKIDLSIASAASEPVHGSPSPYRQGSSKARSAPSSPKKSRR